MTWNIIIIPKNISSLTLFAVYTIPTPLSVISIDESWKQYYQRDFELGV